MRLPGMAEENAAHATRKGVESNNKRHQKHAKQKSAVEQFRNKNSFLTIHQFRD
jgi:hypothetical protein